MTNLKRMRGRYTIEKRELTGKKPKELTKDSGNKIAKILKTSRYQTNLSILCSTYEDRRNYI